MDELEESELNLHTAAHNHVIPCNSQFVFVVPPIPGPPGVPLVPSSGSAPPPPCEVSSSIPPEVNSGTPPESGSGVIGP